MMDSRDLFFGIIILVKQKDTIKMIWLELD